MHETDFQKSDIRKIILFAAIICILNIIFSASFSELVSVFKLNYTINSIPFNSIYEEFFLAVVAAPFIETFFFQFGILYLLRNSNPIIAITISSLLFGLSHWYHFLNFVYGFVVGSLFATSYILIDTKKINPFITICLAHMFYNLFVFLTRH